MIPLLHDFTNQTVLVFGGGSVGARKARRFAREARTIVVSPDFSGEFGDGELVRAAPTSADVSGWFDRAEPTLVVAATDDGRLNGSIEREARERGVLVNRTDTHGSREPGSVVVPATVREDPVVVSISTGGTSPALSRELRKRIEPELAGAGAMASLTAELRAELSDLPAGERREALRAIVSSSSVWKDLRSGDPKRSQVVADVIDSVDIGGEEP
ncbi:precorrin-2 dehydrogenase/sirohydrochlorin ferrochelatase family protein [Halalkalicoccus subterraneus]|uniref:precorrin-2 dehydrogenase/sirohydrochlorin ferrochelatase family protein n=1 Tax=Halalkalicoccus subterraneus TaxID=2675002 RepID=UPI000EFBEACC|nr:bifunctional precorrin-2 dehydrogenase/sirohydrochlorin ferrochelatase [Halalkalicoccus subterraneus]